MRNNKNFDPRYVEPLNREYPITGIKTTQVITKNGKQRYHFDDFQHLKRVYILGLWLRTNPSAGTPRASTGANLINDNAILNGFLTLTAGRYQVVDRAPLSFFTAEEPFGIYPQFFIRMTLDPAECYLDFVNGGSDLVDDEVAEMTWIYFDPENC